MSRWLEEKAHLATVTKSLRAKLRQADTWTDQEGNVHHVESMDLGHAANLVRWLERRAYALHGGECAEWLFYPEPQGEQAGYAFEDERNELLAMTSEEWLERQPLMVALRQRVPAEVPA